MSIKLTTTTYRPGLWAHLCIEFASVISGSQINSTVWCHCCSTSSTPPASTWPHPTSTAMLVSITSPFGLCSPLSLSFCNNFGSPNWFHPLMCFGFFTNLTFVIIVSISVLYWVWLICLLCLHFLISHCLHHKHSPITRSLRRQGAQRSPPEVHRRLSTCLVAIRSVRPTLLRRGPPSQPPLDQCRQILYSLAGGHLFNSDRILPRWVWRTIQWQPDESSGILTSSNINRQLHQFYGQSVLRLLDLLACSQLLLYLHLGY